MARIMGILVLCLAAIVGCPKPDGGVFSAPLVTAEGAESVPGDLNVDSLRLGDHFDEQTVTLDGIATVFHPEMEAIYAVGKLTSVAPPGRLTGRWEHLDSGVRLAEVEETLGSGDLEFWFSVTRPTEGWPLGHYKFYLALDGEDVAGAAFEVAGDSGG